MHGDHEDPGVGAYDDIGFVVGDDDFLCDKKTASELGSVVNPSLDDDILSNEEEYIDPWIKYNNNFPINLYFEL